MAESLILSLTPSDHLLGMDLKVVSYDFINKDS